MIIRMCKICHFLELTIGDTMGIFRFPTTCGSFKVTMIYQSNNYNTFMHHDKSSLQ